MFASGADAVAGAAGETGAAGVVFGAAGATELFHAAPATAGSIEVAEPSGDRFGNNPWLISCASMTLAVFLASTAIRLNTNPLIKRQNQR